MEHYYTPMKKYMNRGHVLKLLTKDSDVLMGEKEVIYCIGMSKMTVVRESEKPKQYDHVQLPEFCEMIGRLADTRYKNQAQLILATKIEFLLDELFAVINYKRKEVSTEVEE